MNNSGKTAEDEVPGQSLIIDESEPGATGANEEYGTRGLGTDPAPDISNRTTSGLVRKDFLILVVDDQIDNVALLSLDLQQQGYRVVTASNGLEAVRVASLMRPSLILMDIGMPELDGLAATSKIREDETLRAVPVVAVTAFSTSGFRRAAYDVGFDGYLTKPIELHQLHELIIRLLSQTDEERARLSSGSSD